MYRGLLSLLIFFMLFAYVFILKLKKETFTNKNNNHINQNNKKKFGLPIYVSLTSIYKKQNELILTLNSILNQTLLPDKIYLNLSVEPFILDDGFKNKSITNKNLSELLNKNKEKGRSKMGQKYWPLQKITTNFKRKME